MASQNQRCWTYFFMAIIHDLSFLHAPKQYIRGAQKVAFLVSFPCPHIYPIHQQSFPSWLDLPEYTNFQLFSIVTAANTSCCIWTSAINVFSPPNNFFCLTSNHFPLASTRVVLWHNDGNPQLILKAYKLIMILCLSVTSLSGTCIVLPLLLLLTVFMSHWYKSFWNMENIIPDVLWACGSLVHSLGDIVFDLKVAASFSSFRSQFKYPLRDASPNQLFLLLSH